MKRLGSDIKSVPKLNVLLVNTNQYFYHIVWPTSETMAAIA